MFQDDAVLGRIAHGLAKLMAILGGLALVGSIAIVVISVTGRALVWAGLRPIMGDYELVSTTMGFAVFAFLPWAHLNRGHAVVTILTDRFSQRVNSFMLIVVDLLMLAAATFIAWRHALGTIDKFNYGETTLLLRMPLGWGYSAGLVGACVFVLVALYVLLRTISDHLAGRAPRLGGGADH